MRTDKAEVSGIIVLFAGLGLLVFTFVSAYSFLGGALSILASNDLTQLFGNAMAPLIEAVIHILYLGIMAWIGSILTIRGVQLLKREKEPTPALPQVKMETKKPIPTSPPLPPSVPKAESKPEPKSTPEAKEPKKEEAPEKPQTSEQPEELETEVPAVA